MGGANNICSDKTGTLTKNEMTVTQIWTGESKPVKVNDPEYEFNDYFANEKHIQLFKEALSCNTSGNAEQASATEQAMIKMMQKLGVDIEKVRK